MKWFVCKTVSEYHYFSIEADSEEEALDTAEECYCDTLSADHTDVEVEYVRIAGELTEYDRMDHSEEEE